MILLIKPKNGRREKRTCSNEKRKEKGHKMESERTEKWVYHSNNLKMWKRKFELEIKFISIQIKYKNSKFYKWNASAMPPCKCDFTLKVIRIPILSLYALILFIFK